MQLYTADNTELMEVSALRPADSNLIVSGTIMGAMPIEAVLTPVELRKLFRLLSFGLILHLVKMLFSGASR
jgi:hypothetical protein